MIQCEKNINRNYVSYNQRTVDQRWTESGEVKKMQKTVSYFLVFRVITKVKCMLGVDRSE